MIVCAGNVCLYNKYASAHKKRFAQPVKALYEEITKAPLPAKKKYLALEVHEATALQKLFFSLFFASSSSYSSENRR